MAKKAIALLLILFMAVTRTVKRDVHNHLLLFLHVQHVFCCVWRSVRSVECVLVRG